MSSNKSEQSLHIEPRSSRQLAILLLLLHGAAVAVAVNLAVPVWLKLGLAGSAIVMLISSWNIYITHISKKSVKVMIWGADGSWTLITGDQDSLHDVKLLPGSFIFPKMMVLQFLSPKQVKYSSVLMSDSIDPGLFRKLLVRLRLDTSN